MSKQKLNKMESNRKLCNVKKLVIKGVSINALPCPFCGGTDLRFNFKMSYGHGDCGFENARIECKGCSGAKGNGYNYGKPTKKDEIKAWEQWNERY